MNGFTSVKLALLCENLKNIIKVLNAFRGVLESSINFRKSSIVSSCGNAIWKTGREDTLHFCNFEESRNFFVFDFRASMVKNNRLNSSETRILNRTSEFPKKEFSPIGTCCENLRC